MPIFEYKCLECGTVTEFLERGGRQNKRVCDGCGSSKLKKKFSSFAGIVKQTETAQRCKDCSSGTCPYAG